MLRTLHFPAYISETIDNHSNALGKNFFKLINLHSRLFEPSVTNIAEISFQYLYEILEILIFA